MPLTTSKYNPFSKIFKSSILLLTITFLVFNTAFSQNKKSLESKKKKIQEEIEKADRLLNETTKDKQISLGQLVIVNKKIEERERLISTINAQIRLINKQMLTHQSNIAALEKELKSLKDEYAKMIVQAYKNRSAYDKLMFIFSAKDFNQAYKRLKYYQQYSHYRKRQAVLIAQTQETLNKKVRELESTKQEKEGLVQLEKQERKNLDKEKNDQQVVIKELQGKEKQLKDQIKAKQKEAQSLQKAIEEAIRKEIEAAKKKGNFVLTPEALELMGKFEKNMGKLPWPVEKGIITGKFGLHYHPVLKNIEINNNGVDITTPKESVARAVFEGTVSKVIIIPNSGKAILVRHGEYLTVYFKIKEAFVQPGDELKTKQEIGNIMTDESTGKTELHFEVWKGKTILNPTDWIYQGK